MRCLVNSHAAASLQVTTRHRCHQIQFSPLIDPWLSCTCRPVSLNPSINGCTPCCVRQESVHTSTAASIATSQARHQTPCNWHGGRPHKPQEALSPFSPRPQNGLLWLAAVCSAQSSSPGCTPRRRPSRASLARSEVPASHTHWLLHTFPQQPLLHTSTPATASAPSFTHLPTWLSFFGTPPRRPFSQAFPEAVLHSIFPQLLRPTSPQTRTTPGCGCPGWMC